MEGKKERIKIGDWEGKTKRKGNIGELGGNKKKRRIRGRKEMRKKGKRRTQ